MNQGPLGRHLRERRREVDGEFPHSSFYDQLRRYFESQDEDLLPDIVLFARNTFQDLTDAVMSFDFSRFWRPDPWSLQLLSVIICRQGSDRDISVDLEWLSDRATACCFSLETNEAIIDLLSALLTYGKTMYYVNVALDYVYELINADIDVPHNYSSLLLVLCLSMDESIDDSEFLIVTVNSYLTSCLEWSFADWKLLNTSIECHFNQIEYEEIKAMLPSQIDAWSCDMIEVLKKFGEKIDFSDDLPFKVKIELENLPLLD